MIPRAFALSLQPRPATEGSAPSLGTDGYPRPPESMLARHSRGRRIDRRSYSLRPALALSHFRIASRSAPSLDRTAAMISEVWDPGIRNPENLFASDYR